MKVAYIFTTSGHTVSYKLGQMILPQLEANGYGAEVVAVLRAERAAPAQDGASTATAAQRQIRTESSASTASLESQKRKFPIRPRMLVNRETREMRVRRSDPHSQEG